MLVPHELRDRALGCGERVALTVIGGDSMTFSAWDHRADALARGLVAAGVARGDRVALLMANQDALDFWVGYVGTHRAGAAAVPINSRYASREIAHVVRDSGAEVVLSAGQHLARIGDLHGLPAIRAATVAEMSADDDAPFDVDLTEADLADLFYTSGTTGLPKGVISTHANTAQHTMRVLGDAGVLLSAIPLATFAGVQARC